jgi:hypothetical protein
VVRKKSPHGYRLSSTNALKHGLFTDGILPSRGPERCPFATVCHVASNPQLGNNCVPGDVCVAERDFFDAYTQDARRQFAFCTAWLSDQQFEETIAQLAIVNLQRQRLSALIARDGLARPKVHQISKVHYGLEATLAAGRYESALSNRWNELMSRIAP